jgi:hypothetical protein
MSAFVWIVLAALSFKSVDCGVAFDPPAHWTVRATPDCDFELRPRGWSAMAKASPWPVPDPPLTLILYERGEAYESALADAEFERDGERLIIPGGQMGNAEAEPYVVGRFVGVVAHKLFRGFIRDQSRLPADQSRVFSGEIEHVVLKTPEGRVIRLVCEGNTPDAHVDCDGAIRQVVRTLIIR